MPPLQPLYNAFRTKYDGIAGELKTIVWIGPPSLTHPPKLDSSGAGETKDFAKFDNALWDTGATSTVVTEHVLETIRKRYDIKPTGITKVNAVGNVHNAETYLVDILLPNNVHITNLNVCCDNIAGTDVLIGMDIIQRGDFCISNTKGKTTFSFCMPSHKTTIDLYIKAMEENAKIRKRNKRKR